MRRARQRVPRDARENETGRRGGRGPGVPMMTHLRQIGRQAPAPQTQGRERLQQRPHHGGAARAPRAARGVGARGWAGRNSPDRVDDAFDIPRGRDFDDEPARGVDRSEENKTLVIRSLVPRGRGHTAPRERTTPCRRVLASDRARGRRRHLELRRARTGRPTEGTSVRNARGRGSASTGGSEGGVRSAGARASASTGGTEASARSAGARASASTGGTEASARSAGAGAFASTGGTEASARSAGAPRSASTGGSDTTARSVARLARRPLG